MKENLKLKEFLPYRLSVLSNLISRDIARDYQTRFSITIPEWRVMAILGEAGGLSASAVAKSTAMDKVAVSRAVARLEEVKFITRRIDRADKRRAILSLSPKGREIYQQVVPVALGYESKILGKLTPEDKQSLDLLLEKLTEIQANLNPVS
ncbi:MAG: MarR family transcriptional regulator [Sphingomonadales bacterium]